MPADDRKIVSCRGCGMPIFFEQGVPWYAKKVPVLIWSDEGLEGAHRRKVPGYVSHFVNCPKASQFGGGRDAAMGGPGTRKGKSGPTDKPAEPA